MSSDYYIRLYATNYVFTFIDISYYFCFHKKCVDYAVYCICISVCVLCVCVCIVCVLCVYCVCVCVCV